MPTTLTRARQRRFWKAACRLQRRLARSGDVEPSPLPQAEWNAVVTLFRRMATARARGWHGAVRRLQRRAVTALAELIRACDTRRRTIDPDQQPALLSRPADLFRDLVALDAEFPEVRCDLRAGTISVVTEAIVLSGHDLGAFEIRLSGQPAPLSYRVIACDPVPASRSDEITHPHVDGEILCEGDGRSVIRAALQQGRLADFFLIVRQILGTYNPGSAYVTLDEWQGRDCPDCGVAIDEEESGHCTTCGTDYCDACVRDCGVCGDGGCGSCQTPCPACEDSVCPACLTTCDRCRESLCERCRDDNHCPRCETHDEESPTDAGTAVHAVCLEQTPVSA